MLALLVLLEKMPDVVELRDADGLLEVGLGVLLLLVLLATRMLLEMSLKLVPELARLLLLLLLLPLLLPLPLPLPLLALVVAEPTTPVADALMLAGCVEFRNGTVVVALAIVVLWYIVLVRLEMDHAVVVR